jgi:hypothetical protein
VEALPRSRWKRMGEGAGGRGGRGRGQGGHLEVLKWARERHCPWDRRTREQAEEYGHVEVLRWAQEHGAP